MRYHVINIDDYPLEDGESMYVVHPNNAECTLSFPEGAQTMCTKDLRYFKKDTLYFVTGHVLGWVTLVCSNEVCKMPEYVYARHFDAETYVINRNIEFPSNQILFTD